MSQNMSICRDADHVEIDIPAVGGIIQVRLELTAELCVAARFCSCVYKTTLSWSTSTMECLNRVEESCRQNSG